MVHVTQCQANRPHNWGLALYASSYPELLISPLIRPQKTHGGSDECFGHGASPVLYAVLTGTYTCLRGDYNSAVPVLISHVLLPCSFSVLTEFD
jgi:hypothetical protein